MAIEITHLGHTYTYSHPIGWTGGDELVCEKLNEDRPAGDYPEGEAEKLAIRHALAGILAGGEVVAHERAKHSPRDLADAEVEDVPVSTPDARPDRILEESGGEDRSRAPAADPDRILEDTGDEDRTGASAGDPDRILEG